MSKFTRKLTIMCQVLELGTKGTVRVHSRGIASWVGVRSSNLEEGQPSQRPEGEAGFGKAESEQAT